MWDTCKSHLGPYKFDLSWQGGQGRSKSAPEWPIPKIILVAQKKQKSSKNYTYLISHFDENTKDMFFFPERDHICQIGQIGKGRDTLLHGVTMGLPRKI